MSYSINDLISLTRQVADAVDSDRWSNAFIKTVLSSVFEDEWSNILNAAPYYTFALRNVTTDINGQIPFASLNAGSGDAQQNYYRVMSVSDGNVLYTETRFQDVPLATTTNYLPTYPRLYYMVGNAIQILPLGSSSALIVGVNYKPTSLDELSTDDVAVDFPDNQQLLLACETGARMLALRAGAEASGGQVLRNEADRYRTDFLDDLRRRTINPTRMAYPDLAKDWGG